MMTATFKLRNLTKGTARYEETTEPAIIGTIYVRKTALNDKIPENITVTITEN